MPEKKDNSYIPITERIPWAKASESSGIPLHLNYFDGSMFEAVENIAKK